MSTIIALLLASFMIDHGTPARIVDNGNGTAIVIIEGRPGCTAETLYNDPTQPVIVCKSPRI